MISVMLSWSAKRQILIIGIFAGGLAVMLGASFLVSLQFEPSCSDNARNRGEEGVDCGGPCARICPAGAIAPIVYWVRSFEVSEGVWGAAAYLENQNNGAGVRSAPYLFKLYDEENLLIYERRGVVYIPPRKVFAIFEGAMSVGARIPARASFEFTSPLVFEKLRPDPELVLGNKEVIGIDNASRLEGSIYNPSFASVTGVFVTTVLYNGEGNAFASSQTAVKNIPARSGANLAFTWPSVFPEPPARIELLYAVSP